MKINEAIRLAAQDDQLVRRTSWRVDVAISVRDNNIVGLDGRLSSPTVQDILADDWEVLSSESQFKDNTIYMRKNGETWILIQGNPYKLTSMNLPGEGCKVKSFTNE